MNLNNKKRSPNHGKRGPNKVTAEVKSMVMQALDKAGGVDYLVDRANDPKSMVAFLALVGKVMPLQVAGDPDNPLKFNMSVEFVKPK